MLLVTCEWRTGRWGNIFIFSKSCCKRQLSIKFKNINSLWVDMSLNLDTLSRFRANLQSLLFFLNENWPRTIRVAVPQAILSISIYIAAVILYIYICVMCTWCIVASPSTLKLLDYYLVFKQIVCILCCSLSSKCGYFLTTRDISIMLLINIEKDTLVN
jgi:hypothetical protein